MVSVGVLLPTRETAMSGSYDFATMLDYARKIESYGFDSAWAGDSFVARPRLEPLTLLSAVVAATDELAIGTAALIAVLREPLTLAHTIATLDQVSGGRLQLGIGTGAPLPTVRSEAAAVPMPYAERAGRIDEAVMLWKRAWNKDDAELTGDYWDLSGLRDQAPPSAIGGPPFWLASNNTPRAVARTARYYDGWMPLLPDPAEYGRGWASIREAARGFGRDPEDITPSLFATVNLNPDAERARDELDEYTRRYYRLPLAKMSEIQPYFGGSAESCAQWLGEYVRAGARHFVLRMGSFEEPEKHLRATAETVLPALREMTADHTGIQVPR